MRLILGTASPSRQRIVKAMGLDCTIMPSNIDEKAIRSDDPIVLVKQLANAKAQALINLIDEAALIITCDQVALFQGKILEKPTSKKELKTFLHYYNDSQAQTVSAMQVTNTTSKASWSAIDQATVFFHPMDDACIETLAKHEELMQCAGGFQIEATSPCAKYVKTIEGDPMAVQGLSPTTLNQLLKQANK